MSILIIKRISIAVRCSFEEREKSFRKVNRVIHQGDVSTISYISHALIIHFPIVLRST